MKTPDHIITCVYCGQAYPENTPTHGADVKVLTEHIKKCPKHPMRELENELTELRNTFSLRWNADRRAIKLWQKDHPGQENIWPDHADLVIYLLNKIDLLQDSLNQSQSTTPRLKP